MFGPSHVRARIFRAAAWIGLVSVGLAHGQTAPSVGGVEGVVLNTATGAGIPGATVMLNNAANRYSTTTDAVGHFKISGVAPGYYRASVDKDGFDEPVPDLTSFGRPTLQIASSVDPVRVDLKMTARTTIRGRVLDPDGRPLAGIEVNLNPNIFGSETTDQEGRYALHDVRADTYTLTARPPSTLKPIEAPDGSRTAMVTTYYPSVDDATLAQQVVFQGQDLDAYDIRLRTLPVHRVKGIVLDEQGMPAVNAELSLYRAAGAERTGSVLSLQPGGSTFLIGARRAFAGEPEVRVPTGKDGRFELPAVPRGDWRITAESDPRIAEGRISHGATSVAVTRGDVEDLRISLAAPFRLTGTVEHKGDATAPAGTTQTRTAFAVALIGADDNALGQSGIERNGALSIENLLPGRYRALTKPGFAAQIFVGDSDVTGQEFSLSAGGPELRVVLKRWSGTVRGTVDRGEGATVVLMPRQTDSASYGQTALCGPGGSFEFNDVSPGDYNVAAIDRISGMPPSPAILGLVSSRGTSVKVEEGAAANVALSVIAAPR